MALSRTAVDTLLDLVEIKLGYMEISDTEDRRSMRELKHCRDELRLMRRIATAVVSPAAPLGSQPVNAI